MDEFELLLLRTELESLVCRNKLNHCSVLANKIVELLESMNILEINDPR